MKNDFNAKKKTLTKTEKKCEKRSKEGKQKKLLQQRNATQKF